EVHGCAEVAEGRFRSNYWLVLLRRQCHLRRSRRSAVPAYVDKIYVVAALCDVVHPREPIQRQVECRFGGICRTVHVQHNLLRRDSLHGHGMFVAYIKRDARTASGKCCTASKGGGRPSAIRQCPA